jgi:hypothetical protein
VVVYCAYGHEVGQQAAETLRAAGWNARHLAGGIEGGEPASTHRARWPRGARNRCRPCASGPTWA